MGVAARLLAVADDPVNPDWKIISARGTVLAKQGKYGEAVPFYERALTMAPDQPSLLSNLALAHAMNGDAAKAETMLRQAAAADRSSLKIRQNLALVMGLQGKYDEAKLIASSDLSPENAAENANALRKITKLEQSAPPAAKAPAKVAADPVVPPLPMAKPAMTEPMKPSPAPKLPFSFEVAQWSSTTTVTRAKAPAPKMIAAGSKARDTQAGGAKLVVVNGQVAKAPAAKAPVTDTQVPESPLEIMLAAAKTLAAKATAVVEQDIKVASAMAMPTRKPVRKVKARQRRPRRQRDRRQGAGRHAKSTQRQGARLGNGARRQSGRARRHQPDRPRRDCGGRRGGAGQRARRHDPARLRSEAPRNAGDSGELVGNDRGQRRGMSSSTASRLPRPFRPSVRGKRPQGPRSTDRTFARAPASREVQLNSQKRMAAGPRMTTNSTGRKKRIIGTVSLGGRAAAFFSASDMRMSRFSLAMTRSAWPTGVP